MLRQWFVRNRSCYRDSQPRRWTAAESRRIERILLENVAFPQTFVRAWALDSLATLSEGKAKLLPIVLQHLEAFAQSSSKALQARARAIRERLARGR